MEAEPIEFDVFLEAARLLYDGGLVAERHAAVGEFVRPPSRFPAIRRDWIDRGRNCRRAGEVPAHRYVSETGRLADRKDQAMARMEGFDALMVPTAPSTRACGRRGDPAASTRRWTYTNFCNLFDLCAVAVPPERWTALNSD